MPPIVRSLVVRLCGGERIGATGDHVANFHDCGHDVTARLSADQAVRLSNDLDGLLHIETLESFQADKGYR